MEAIEIYQADLTAVLRPESLIICESQTEGFISYRLLDGTYLHNRQSPVYVDEHTWRC